MGSNTFKSFPESIFQGTLMLLENEALASRTCVRRELLLFSRNFGLANKKAGTASALMMHLKGEDLVPRHILGAALNLVQLKRKCRGC